MKGEKVERANDIVSFTALEINFNDEGSLLVSMGFATDRKFPVSTCYCGSLSWARSYAYIVHISIS